MRGLLKPVIARELGVVLLKPGSELMSLFSGGRVLVERQPESMKSYPAGRVPDALQPLAFEQDLIPFFHSEKVIYAAGGLPSLENWLLRSSSGHCQNEHSDYHYHEMTVMRHEPGALRLCGYCDNLLRGQYTEALAELARQNLIDWILDTIRSTLLLDKTRQISLSELCWWAVIKGVFGELPESVARKVLRLPQEKMSNRESDIVPSVPATSIIADKVAEMPIPQPVVVTVVEPESPLTFMKRPKRIRWENSNYLAWVKTQPCACCGQQADDPHHLIGWGQGGMATKAHDIFVIPLCRIHHTELHNDPTEFERKYGAQPVLIINLLDRAYALGVLA